MKPIIIVNWKMNLTLDEAYNKAKRLNNKNHSALVLLAPPAPYLAYLAKNFKNLNICAQNVSDINDPGAYTGEYSAKIIKSCNVNYTIIGHSERRNIQKESSQSIKQKALHCIEAKVTPIICIGEALEARKNNVYKEYIAKQIKESIPENARDFIIAYEPSWAIGSGLAPTIEEISEIFALIKSDAGISVVANNIQLVYGGSVSSRNYKEIIAIPDSDGIILGSASLDDKELDIILN